ncbi:MAG: iron chelate uptake ABC transporter family permease subunit, partial [Egibacteraceae bacterium]
WRPARATALAGLLGVGLALFVVTIAAGSVAIPLGEVVMLLVGGTPSEASWATIVWQVRLPRAVTAVLAGAALGVGGLQMQTLFRNPLADPFILGITSGASLGVALVVLVAGTSGTALVGGLGPFANLGVAGAAAVGAGVVTTLVLAVSRRVTSPATVLIIGLMAGYATSAVVSVLFASGFGRLERVQAYIAWGFGSFGGTTWTELRVVVPCVLAGLVVAALVTKQLNVLLLGDRYAASMGLHVRRARLLVILSASLLAGTVTAFCGPVAFIGVAAPHLARALLGTSDHRVVVPASAVVGAVVALAAGIVAGLPGQDGALPLNAVTSLIGAPVVVAILLQLRRRGQGVVT